MLLLSVSASVLSLLVAPATADARSVWPTHGQASLQLDGNPLRSSPHQHAVPIASVAKVMTAVLVLRHFPVRPGHAGFRMTVTPRDVADTARRIGREESYVPVRSGERLTETQALAALLLPSANNIAVMLARKAAGTVARFVRWMNILARKLGLKHTRYTDPSGFDPRTVSTAADQTTLAKAALKLPMFRTLVRTRSYRIPVAGVVHSTDTLLGHDGFAGIKTGSMWQSGGCFMFLSHRLVWGERVDVVGVVLGQPGPNLIAAGLRAAKRLVDRVAPYPA
jgi:D-alanyl-D-alanine carboxypeptidase (penicillin-binding protein 5/6)